MSKKEVIVIADDDPTIRKVMKAALEKGGFEVVDVDNGAMACAAFAQHSPSIVLLDVEMPVQDGFSACAQIRRLPGGETVPIEFQTDFSFQGTLDIGLENTGYNFQHILKVIGDDLKLNR